MSANDVFEMTAADYQEAIKQIAEAEIERKLEALKDAGEHGYLMYGPVSPAQKLAGIMRETLPNEFLMLQDPDCYTRVLEQAYVFQPQVWVLFGQDGQKVERPHADPRFTLAVFASEQEAILYGQMLGLITPEMLLPTVDPMSGMQMPPQLPIQAQGNRWFRLLGLTHWKGQGPFVWQAAEFRRLWSAYGRRLEQSAGVMA